MKNWTLYALTFSLTFSIPIVGAIAGYTLPYIVSQCATDPDHPDRPTVNPRRD